MMISAAQKTTADASDVGQSTGIGQTDTLLSRGGCRVHRGSSPVNLHTVSLEQVRVIFAAVRRAAGG